MVQFLVCSLAPAYSIAIMRGMFSFIGTTVLGSVGWAIGAYVGMGTAIVLSCVGSGFGMYWGRKLFDHWLG